MPITLNGTGTISGISAGGLPDGCVDTDTLASDTASGLCKAWVNFNGSGTVAIRDSYNVSSITDNGAGDYTVNFTTALEDANYSATFGMALNNTTSVVVFGEDFSYTRTASTMRTNVRNHNANTLIDWGYLQVAIFR